MLTYFICSCFLAYVSNFSKLFICAFLFFSAVVVALLNRLTPTRFSSDSGKTLIFMLSAALISSLVSFYFFGVRLEKFEKADGTAETAEVKILSCEYSLSYISGYTAEIRSSNSLPQGTKLLITSESGGFDYGDILSCTLSYSSLSSLGDSGFDSVRYYLPKGIMLSAEAYEIELCGHDDSFSVSRLFELINRKLTSILTANLKHDAGGLSSAALLGSDSALSETFKRDFRRLGITHLLVVSGSHFSVLISTLSVMMKKMKIKKYSRMLLSIVSVVLFMGITGFTASVLRAGVMILVSELSECFRRKPDSLNSLAFSGVFMLALNPYFAVDCGLQLSFVATYSCIVFSMSTRADFLISREKRKTLPKPILTAVYTLLMTTFVNLTMLPVMWMYFGEFSILSILVNLIFIPMITVFMYLAASFLLLYPIRIFIPLLSAVINAYSDLISFLTKTLSSLSGVIISADYGFAPILLIPCSILIIILPLYKNKAKKRMFFSSLACLSVFLLAVNIAAAADRDNIYVNYISRGKNDGFVVKADGNILLCDISDGSYSFAKRLSQQAEKEKICEIDALLFTHYHKKHVSLLSQMSEKEILRSVLLPEPINESENEIYTALCAAAEKNGVKILTIPSGASLEYHGITVEIKERTYLSRSSHPVTSLSLSKGGADIVYASGGYAEAELIPSLQSAEYPILGNHSPINKATTSLSFDSARRVVISDTAFQLCTEETKEALEKSNALVSPTHVRIKIKAD